MLYKLQLGSATQVRLATRFHATVGKRGPERREVTSSHGRQRGVPAMEIALGQEQWPYPPGKHYHQCQVCGHQCTAEAGDEGIVHEQRMRIAQLWCERVSLRWSCRATGVRLTWLLHCMGACSTARPDHLHVQLPARPTQSWCPGWKPKPMRGGAGYSRRRTHTGSGSLWMRPPAKSLRFMEGIAS